MVPPLGTAAVVTVHRLYQATRPTCLPRLLIMILTVARTVRLPEVYLMSDRCTTPAEQVMPTTATLLQTVMDRLPTETLFTETQVERARFTAVHLD